MAASDSTAPDAAQSTLPPPDPHKELHDALYGLQKAISLVKVATAAPVDEADPAQHEQAMELVIGQLDKAYDAMDQAIVNAATAAEAEGTHEEPQASARSPASAADAQPSPVPLSEELRQVAIRLGDCHSAIALMARALVASETVEEQAEAGGWAADELEGVEPDLKELADTITMSWSAVRCLEEKAAASEVRS